MVMGKRGSRWTSQTSTTTGAATCLLAMALRTHHHLRAIPLRYDSNESEELVLPKVLWAFNERGRARPSSPLLQSPQLIEHNLHVASSGDHHPVHERSIPKTNAVRDLCGRGDIVYATR